MIHLLFIVCSVLSVSAWFPEEYPDYCLKNFTARDIPPLTADQLSQVSELKQVQFIVRHGARTPYSAYTCWNDYDVSWNNCNVTDLTIPSNSYTSQVRPASWLFRKIYDGSPNALGGNCLTGQLIGEGYEQEEAVGSALYNAYLNNPNPNLNLFPTSEWSKINTTTDIYLRSDDIERVLASGQIVMHTFFNVTEDIIVDWHTGDYNLDQIYPNSEVCPRLNTVSAAAYSTPEWLAENDSVAINTLSSQLDDIMGKGVWSWNYIFDCLMTTVCTDRPVPDGSVEHGAVMDQAIFNATIAQVEFEYAFMSLYNDSEWAKLAMGNVVWNLRTNIENMLNYDPSTSTDPSIVPPYKLAVYAGHDTTVMPFLASILKTNWDGKWAPYASLVTIELYSSTASPADSSKDLFRMVYNGVPQLVPGCGDTLCDVNVLLDAMAFGQEFMPCAVPDAVPSNVDTGCEADSDDSDLSTTGWILLIFASLVLGVVIGAAVVVFAIKRKMVTFGTAADKDTHIGGDNVSPLM